MGGLLGARAGATDSRAGLLLGPWRRTGTITLSSLQRIVHGLPTAHTMSSSKPLSCSRVGPQLGGAQWGHPWVGQNPDLDLLLLPSCCRRVGLGDLTAVKLGMAMETPRSQQGTDPALCHRAAQPWEHSGKYPSSTQGLKPKDPLAQSLHGLEAPKTLWPFSFMDQGS